MANNSLLIVTWDEDDGRPRRNQIPTVIYGAHVQPGTYNEQINHYNVLSTLEQMYGLPKTGNAANAAADRDHLGPIGPSPPSLLCAAWLLTSCRSA